MRQAAREAPSPGPAAWLALAASPVFAIMAFVTANDPVARALCSAGSGTLPIGGMPAMYLLMSLFHLPPWLRLRAAPPWARQPSKGDLP